MKKLISIFIFLIIGLNLHAQNKMFKNPGCMCCDRWAEHMQNHGINLEIVTSKKMGQIKNELRIPDEARGCHTSIVDGIIVEGHVPADIVTKIIKERPEGIIGISVPGMPMGSPGMEGEYKEDYPIFLFDSEGTMYFQKMK